MVPIGIFKDFSFLNIKYITRYFKNTKKKKNLDLPQQKDTLPTTLQLKAHIARNRKFDFRNKGEDFFFKFDFQI